VTTETQHPDYPIRRGDQPMDRCVCGGVRHWHAPVPRGCDDCNCVEFVIAEDQPTTPFVCRIDARQYGSPPLVDVRVFAGPQQASLGLLTMRPEEAEDFAALLGGTS
jgi:hypothetical protein